MKPKPNMEEIKAKTEALCQVILDQPAFEELKKMIHNFYADQEAQSIYNNVIELQEFLEQKQRHGIEITREEIEELDEAREAVYTHPVSRDFLYANREFDKVKDWVTQSVIKTIELGRIPDEEDLFGGRCACGSSCGCGGH